MFFLFFSENMIFSFFDLFFVFDFKSSLISTSMEPNKQIFLHNLTLSDLSRKYCLFSFGNDVFVGIICFQAPHFMRFPGTQMLKLFI